MAVTVLRQYLVYDLIDAKSFNVTLDITMKITERQSFFLLPVEGYLTDLKITDSEGHSMIILSDHEFEKKFGFSMNKIKENFLGKLSQNPNENIKEFTTKYRTIAVLFNNKDLDEYYEKIKIQWKAEANIQNEGWISKHSEIPIFIPQYGFKQNVSSAIYLSIRTDSKHKILGNPTLTNRASDKNIKYTTIFDNTNHKTYRFNETTETQLIHISVKMGLPRTVIRWAKLGSGTAIVALSGIISVIMVTKTIPAFTFELMAGIIALLIGERVLIFRDIPLMKKWNTVYLILTSACIALLVILVSYLELLKHLHSSISIL